MNEESGFVYIWRDRKHNRYYIGSHWGKEDDGYVCSSKWMKKSYFRRPNDFKRRILTRVYSNRKILLEAEGKWLDLIKKEEIKVRYYNLRITNFGHWTTDENRCKTVGEKISLAKRGKNTGPRAPEIGLKISEAKKKSFEQRIAETGSAFTKDHKTNMSIARTGTVQTKESNNKRSITMKAGFDSGRLTARSGHFLSEEHKAKIGKAGIGRMDSEETTEIRRVKASKEYEIIFDSGKVVCIVGLKKFAYDNSIPYVTCYKAVQNQTPIKKYKIVSICITDNREVLRDDKLPEE